MSDKAGKESQFGLAPLFRLGAGGGGGGGRRDS